MSSPTEISSWKLVVLAAALALPLFLVLKGASVSLPENFFEVSGIPIHASALAFVLLPKQFLTRPSELLLLLVYLIYGILSFWDSGERLQLTVQLLYFIYGYKLLRELHPQVIEQISRYIAIVGGVFIALHAFSIMQAVISGNIFSAASSVFGFVIYQSHLTYPIVLTLILVSVSRTFVDRPWLRLTIVALVMFIEMVLMRRVGLAVFLLYIILFERRFLLFALVAILASALMFEEVAESLLGIFSFAERLTTLTDNGNFTRMMTWERSYGYLNEIATILIGNGYNNHSHNFFLHTVTTHGLIISLFFLAPITYWVVEMMQRVGIFNRNSILALAIVVVDWNLNVNLYQPYYSLMFAFFLVSTTVLEESKKNEP